MHLFAASRRSIALKGLAAGAATFLVLGAASVFADDPHQGPAGSVPPAAADNPGSEPANKGGVGVLAASNFGSLNAGNTCVGDRAVGHCEDTYIAGQDLEVMDADPVVRILNAQPGNTPTRWWQFHVDSNNSFTLSDETGGSTTPFRIDNDAPTNSVHVDTNGNIGVGIGSPLSNIHIARTGIASLRLDSTGGSGNYAEWYQGGSGLWLDTKAGASTTTTPIRIDSGTPTNLLTLNSNNRIGVGTSSPLTRLQVGPGSTGVATAGASLLAEEGIASAAIIKSTSGPEMFLYEDQNNGLMGTASNTPFGLRSNNTNRFWMTQGGSVGIGTNFTDPQHLLQVFNSGGAFTDGSSWVNASSRSLKENFQATDDQSVLQKLVSLPVDSWNYKVEGDGIRHLGPTAEDFMTAFGLGSTDKAISTVDADGVAMAAIKGLYDEVQSKDTTIQRVSSENTKLQQRLDALESRMNGLDGGARPAGVSASTRGSGVATSSIAAAALALFAFGAVAGLGLSVARRHA